jgi:hypothetical protein
MARLWLSFAAVLQTAAAHALQCRYPDRIQACFVPSQAVDGKRRQQLNNSLSLANATCGSSVG